MGQYFNQQPVINLGSGTSFGNGYTARNVNLGTVPVGYGQTQPTMVPNPEYKTNPYGLEDDQALEKWGKSKKIVGKNASEGIMRNLQGLADFATFGLYDFDNRGNLFGGEHLPGLGGGGSGYGGEAQLGSVSEMMPNPQIPQLSTGYPNTPVVGGPVPGNQGTLGHLATAGGIGALNHFAGRFMNNQYLNDAYNMNLKARQAADAQSVLTSQAMQRTDKGQSERATEQQNRGRTAAETNYLRRLGVAAMLKAAKEQPGLQRTYTPGISSAGVNTGGMVRMG